MKFFAKLVPLSTAVLRHLEMSYQCRDHSMEKTSTALGQTIRNARVSKGYTQQQLADQINVNLRSIQRIEKGEVTPRSYTLNLLADHLELADDIRQMPLGASDVVATLPNQTTKLISTIASGLLIIFLTAAFLSQSARFPETSFDLFVLIAIEIMLYSLLLLRIWRS